MNLDDSIKEAQIGDGPHDKVSELSQSFKFLMRRGTNWDNLHSANKEAFENIATRIAMILEGDMDKAHHWNKLARVCAHAPSKALEKPGETVDRPLGSKLCGTPWMDGVLGSRRAGALGRYTPGVAICTQ